MNCDEIRARFSLAGHCCNACHPDLAERGNSILQGGQDIEICCSVLSAIEETAAYCDGCGEWYPPGLQCLSCSASS